MPSKAVSWRVGVLAVAIAAISAAHYVTPVQHFLLHNVWQRAYYIPVLLACAWFGLRGGLVAAVASAATYAPHILLHWGHSQAYQANQVLELGMFGVIAVVAGALSDRERRSRDELLRADRLAALGTLAAGMAHEIKNPLGAIAGAAEILDQDYPKGHPRREFLDILREEIARLTTITGKYLGYARSPEPDASPLDLNGSVETTIALLTKSASGKAVTIETALDRSIPKALADAGQIHQALVNLVLNGMQVMPAGGVLTLETGRAGGDVEIRVRDRGPGIPEGDEERIFEPFYTTRPGGTGLGLAMSRRIAVAHRGSLTAENHPGGGAIFRLRLPAASRAE